MYTNEVVFYKKQHKIKKYQLEIIKHKVFNGILNVFESESSLHVDISDKKSISSISFLTMLKIIEIIKVACEYMFSKNGFDLSEGKIFIDKSKKPFLVYLPYENSKEDTDTFIVDFIRKNLENKRFQNICLEYLNSKEVKLEKWIKKKICENQKYIACSFAFLVTGFLLAIFLSQLIYFLISIVFVISFIFLITKPKEERNVSSTKSEIGFKTVLLDEVVETKLVFSDQFGNEHYIKIKENETKYIGRDIETCALVLDSKTVSRKHAKIINEEGVIYIEDNDSANATFLNKERLKKSKTYEIKNGDRVIIANEEFLLYKENV